MKKTVLSILAVCSLVSLTGCGAPATENSSDQVSSATEEATTTSAEKPTPKDTPDSTTAPVEETEMTDPSALELGKEVRAGAYTVTVKDLSIVSDVQGNEVLKVTFDWENNGGTTIEPGGSVWFLGFQDGVETDLTEYSEEIDDKNFYRQAKPGVALTDVETGVGITDMSKPLVLELQSFTSSDIETYTMTIDDLNAL